jgi:hypothetical protein
MPLTWSIVSNPGPDATYNLGDQLRIVGGPFPNAAVNTQVIVVQIGGNTYYVPYNGGSFDGSSHTFTFIYDISANDASSSGIVIPTNSVYGQAYDTQTFSGFSVSGTPASSYSISPANQGVIEGGYATFTVTTSNVAPGQQIRYRFSGIADSDISIPSTGTLTVGANGSASITLQAISDNVQEGSEVASLTVGEVLQDTRYSGFIQERSVTATLQISDTSVNPISSSSTVVSTPICFARGTHIQIGEQSKPVETLSISNQVSTKTASAAIKWIGYQRRTPEFAQFQDYLPVKISAGALDDHVPLRDLYLSPDHAVLVDGHLVHAKALVNGKTIVQMTEWAGDIEYYHIETEAHEIIYAEGVPCETFVDNVSREQFDNYAEYQALYPNTRMMKELRLPRVRFKRQLPESIKQRLESRIDELDRQHSFI